jgi:hypothetical protein
MTSRTDVAKWMIDTIDREHFLDQEDAVTMIADKFGDEWVYQNENGNLGIDRRVLSTFRKLHGGRIEWDKGDKCWAPA